MRFSPSRLQPRFRGVLLLLTIPLLLGGLLTAQPASANAPAQGPFSTGVTGGGDSAAAAQASVMEDIRQVEYRWLVECTVDGEITVYELYPGHWGARADIDCELADEQCYNMNYKFDAKDGGQLMYSVLFRQEACRSRAGEVRWKRGPDHRTFEAQGTNVDVTPTQCGGGATEPNERHTDFVESFCSYEGRSTGSFTLTVGWSSPQTGLGVGGELAFEPTPRNYSHRVVARPDGCFLISGVGEEDPICT